MASQGIRLLGSALAVLGWLGVLLSCILPMWRMTSFVGATIVTSEVIWEGIWMTCVIQSTGQTRCDPHDSMLALSTNLKAAEVFTVVSLQTGLLGLILAFIGGKCTRFLAYSNSDANGRVATAAGVVLIICAVLCLIPVTWTAVNVIQMFYNPQIINSQRREIGPSIYIGWGGSILLLLGGDMLCSAYCSQKTANNTLLVNCRPVSTSNARRSRQVRVHSPNQNRKILVRSECSDYAPVIQKNTSEESKKSKTSTTKSEGPVIESARSDRPSTKSQLNHADSIESLGSYNSDAASACPEKTYI